MGFARFTWGVDEHDDKFVGDDIAVETTWTDPVTGALLDFTSWTGILEIRKRPGETLLGTGTVTFPSAGVIRGDITDTTTTTLGDGDFCFDVKTTDTGGLKDHMFGGTLRLKDPCTV